jgi:hypothetical protein
MRAYLVQPVLGASFLSCLWNTSWRMLFTLLIFYEDFDFLVQTVTMHSIVNEDHELQRHPYYYLEDGNLIVQVRGYISLCLASLIHVVQIDRVLFQIHEYFLKRSLVLHDFLSEQPDALQQTILSNGDVIISWTMLPSHQRILKIENIQSHDFSNLLWMFYNECVLSANHFMFL